MERERFDWERGITETEPQFESLKKRLSRGELAPNDASLAECAKLLEALYLYGAEEVPSEQAARKQRLLEKAKECIPYASQTDFSVLRMHVEAALGLDDVILADHYASEAQRLVESGLEVSQDVRQNVLRDLGLVRHAQNIHAEAAQLYIRAIEVAPNSEAVPSLVQWASVALWDAGLYAEALPYLKEVVAKVPHHWIHEQFLAEAYERIGKWDDAIKLYEDQRRRAKARGIIEYFSFRIGFCEARRDDMTRRPTGAHAGVSATIVEPDGQSNEPGELTEHEKTRMQVIKAEQRFEQHLAAFLGGKGGPPISAVVEPNKPFSNLAHLRQALEACEEYIWWWDPHFQSRALDQLAQAAAPTRVRSIRILSSDKVVENRDRRNWQLFVQEMEAKGIKAEWRTSSTKFAHDRFIIGANKAFNIPPVASLFRGDYSEIIGTDNRPPFQRWWDRARPI